MQKEKIFKFLASFQGRVTRIIAGILLAFFGVFSGNILILVIGLIPLTAGIFDKCALAPLFKLPFDGPQLRHKLNRDEPEVEVKPMEEQKNVDTDSQNQVSQPVNNNNLPPKDL